VLLALGAVGCNQVFGLDPTVPLPPDTDEDSVFDPEDNCPRTDNADQADADLDGFGDACDSCPALATATNHDEDGDLRGDDCDACPNIADFGDDVDKDGVPNECDTDTGTMTLLGFDPFIELHDDWQSRGATWRSRSDSIEPDAALATNDTGLEDASLIVEGTSWYLDIGVTSARRWRDGDRFGVGLRGTDGSLFACEIVCAPDCLFMLTVPGLGTSTEGFAVPVPAARMRVGSRPGSRDASCCARSAAARTCSRAAAAPWPATRRYSAHPISKSRTSQPGGTSRNANTDFAAWRNEPQRDHSPRG
jgi:hypothetical protein